MAQTTAEDGGRVPMSPGLQATLLRAREYAASQSEAQVLLEHLLLALSEDADAGTVLESCQIDLARLRRDVAGYIGSLDDRVPAGTAGAPAISPALTQVLKYATLAAQQGRRSSIDGAIVLAALVGDGRSMAASFLKAQGLTFEAAIRALREAATKSAPAAPETSPPPPTPASAPASGQPIDRAPIPTRPLHAEAILAQARERVENRNNRTDRQAPPAPVHTVASEWPAPISQLDQPPATPATAPARASLDSANGAPADHHIDPQPDPLMSPPMDAPPAARDTPVGAIQPTQPPPSPIEPAKTPPPIGPSTETPQHREAFEPSGVVASDTDLPSGPSNVPQQAPAALPTVNVEAEQGRLPNSAAPANGWTPPPRPQSPPVRPPLPQPTHAQPPGPTPQTWPNQQRGEPPPRPHQPIPQPGSQPPWTETARPQYPGAPAYPGPTRHRPDEAAIASRQPAIHPSQISCTLPRSLRQGRAHVVEVRIERPPLTGVRGGSQSFALRPETVVARAIAVRLRATTGSLWIDVASPETQWDQSGAPGTGRFGSEDAVWRFTVTPLKSGKGVLQLSVGARTLGADGVLAETQLPDQIQEMRIAPAYGSLLARAGSVALIALGGIVGVKILEGLLRMDLFFLAKQLLRF